MKKQEIKKDNGLCLNNYLDDVFDYKQRLLRGERITPIIYRLDAKSSSSSKLNTNRRRSEVSHGGSENFECDSSHHDSMDSIRNSFKRIKSWKTSTKLPALLELVF